jgi:Bacterial Ig-like domain (group 2)
MLTGRKLALTLAFTVLVALAFGVSCKGFFVKPTLASITINPTAPSVQVGQSTTLVAFGLDNETPPVGSNLTSGVSWSSGTPTVAIITGPCATGTCGNVTIQGVTAGTSTISAGAESVTGTATLTVFLGNVTNFQVCEGTFGNTTSCSSGGTPLTWDASGVSKGGVTQPFVAQATNPTPPPPLIDLSTQATWTVSTSLASSITCVTNVSPVSCTVAQNTAPNTYPDAITVTYGTSSSASITVVVTN